MDLLPYLLPFGDSLRVTGLTIDSDAHGVCVEMDTIGLGSLVECQLELPVRCPPALTSGSRFRRCWSSSSRCHCRRV